MVGRAKPRIVAQAVRHSGDSCRNGSATVHTGTYREIDRPRRLVFTWSSPSTRLRDSIVTVTFQPSSNRSTLVEIHQVGLPDEEERASHHTGWSDALRELDRAARDRTRAES